MEWILVKTLLSLAAVLGLMVGVVFVMKRYVVGGHAGSSNIVEMKVIGTMVLQPKRSISVLKVMNKVLIVGVSEEGMQTLAEVTDKQSLKAISEKLEAQASEKKWTLRRGQDAPSFARALTIQLGRLAAKGSH